MKILVVYPAAPYPLDRGTHQRTFHLLRELARAHEVSLVALAENGQGLEHAAIFGNFCASVEIIPFVHPPWAKLFPKRLLNPLPSNIAHWADPSLGLKLHKILRAQKFDAVHVCDIVMAQYFLDTQIPLVVDRSRVDLQYQLAEHGRMNFPLRARLLRYEGYMKLWFYERKVAQRAALEIVCGPDDEAFLHRWIGKEARVEVLGNGVDLDYFSHDGKTPHAHHAPHPTVLFCGAMDYNPNIDALRWYFGEMHEALRQRITDLRVLVVGKDPVPEIQAYARLPGVTVTGSVPDVRPWYRQAWLHIVPLRIGGGTRLKIVESLAMGTPVISTRIGAQGLGLKHHHEILLADETEDFVRQTADALQDKQLRHSLEIAGGEAVRARFSWKIIGAQLNRIYAERFPSATVRQSLLVNPIIAG